MSRGDGKKKRSSPTDTLWRLERYVHMPKSTYHNTIQ